ncbi:MOB member 4, phocein [Coemansia sp. RSA 2399]|nr:MOB member 4, phocein [Coemansia sp. RSA 2399]KAJ1894052.1 MOB member 4, phocein [Coemansia sp. IMI 209127]
MRANDATFYCAGHGHPRPCSAIGYSVHTIDYAVHQLGSSSVGAADMTEMSMKHFQSMVRRLYRIFAHTYFHHRDMFEQQESATYLYSRFVRLARKYELTPESLIIIPDLPAAVVP